MSSPWRKSWRADPSGAAIADRHYNRQRIGSLQFVPPGACLVLRAPAALWVSSWPKAEYVQHDWAGAWINTLFRREGGEVIASEMIRLAVAHTLSYWPSPPDLGMVSFIDPREIRSSNPGYCYRMAGFEHVGETRGGLLAFQMRPDKMPDPKPVPSDQLTFAFESVAP